jgi:hypothetical protein
MGTNTGIANFFVVLSDKKMMQGPTTDPGDFLAALAVLTARRAGAAPAAVQAGPQARPAGVALTAAGGRRQSRGKGRETSGREVDARPARRGGRERSGGE